MIYMVFKSKRQRQAVMSKLNATRPRQHFITSVKKALGFKDKKYSTDNLIKTYETEISADQQLINAGKNMPKTLIGEALKMTGKIRLHNDEYYLKKLKIKEEKDRLKEQCRSY